MVWLAYISLFLLFARLIVVFVNALTPTVLPAAKNFTKNPLVSVLIPARNEEHTIGRVIESLLNQDYYNTEIIVFDDMSGDDTVNIVRRYADIDNRVRYISGRELPEGWLGKNHACHQLANHASGEYLLFLDADVDTAPSLITDALALMQKHGLHLLSLFPNQKMQSWGELLTVPIMNWILLSLLPLILTRTSAYPSLAAANGQFMLFRADTYHTFKWHKNVKNNPVEDIAIARKMKEAGKTVQTLVPDNQIQCRMYRGWTEAIAGFSKNLPAFFGNNWIWVAFFTIFSTFGVIFVWIAFSCLPALGYLALAGMMRAIIARISRQPVIINILLAPLQQVNFVIMVIKSAVSQKSGNIWKGRKI